MLTIEPVRQDDLEFIHDFAVLVGYGFSSIHSDRKAIAKIIENSIAAFDKEVEKPAGERYLFMMRDGGRVAGMCGMTSKLGGFEPDYAYRLVTEELYSEQLDVESKVKMLELVTDHSGPSAVQSLFIHPDYRGKGLGKFLAYSRFLYMAQHPERFEENVLAEMRGVSDKDGHSPFWHGLGNHFFKTDFVVADRMSGKDKTFISELMPRHPIYVALLDESAQDVIGKPHSSSAPAYEQLKQQGFEDSGMVDIFDGGPIVTCAMRNIRTVRNSRLAKIAATRDGIANHATYLISNTAHNNGFRVTKSALSQSGDDVTINGETAKVLGVAIGDEIRFAELK